MCDDVISTSNYLACMSSVWVLLDCLKYWNIEIRSWKPHEIVDSCRLLNLFRFFFFCSSFGNDTFDFKMFIGYNREYGIKFQGSMLFQKSLSLSHHTNRIYRPCIWVIRVREVGCLNVWLTENRNEKHVAFIHISKCPLNLQMSCCPALHASISHHFRRQCAKAIHRSFPMTKYPTNCIETTY